MALQTQVRAGFGPDIAMRVMTCGAVESVFPEYLVRMSDFFELGHAAMTPVTDLRGNRS
jgi:hypothetical protein